MTDQAAVTHLIEPSPDGLKKVGEPPFAPTNLPMRLLHSPEAPSTCAQTQRSIASESETTLRLAGATNRFGTRMTAMTDSEPAWKLYVLRCGDGTLYCGVTTDLERRLARHSAGTGARYTRGRGPLLLAASWELGSRSAALKAEAAFKSLPRATKDRLVAADVPLPWLPS